VEGVGNETLAVQFAMLSNYIHLDRPKKHTENVRIVVLRPRFEKKFYLLNAQLQSEFSNNELCFSAGDFGRAPSVTLLMGEIIGRH
jgi:hypothetical protein